MSFLGRRNILSSIMFPFPSREYLGLDEDLECDPDSPGLAICGAAISISAAGGGTFLSGNKRVVVEMCTRRIRDFI